MFIVDATEGYIMSLQHRTALVEHVVETLPSMRGFVNDLPTDITAGSWDLVSYSFQCGFEAMWDLAMADNRGLLVRPLLSLWRQSVELAFKSAIHDIQGSLEGGLSHDLKKLFHKLVRVSADAGLDCDDGITRNVETMIEQVQSFDPFADRFRYPAGRKGQPYKGIAIDLGSGPVNLLYSLCAA